MHELLVRRLEKKRFGHVFFHGGVDGSQRKKLIDRFARTTAAVRFSRRMRAASG